MGLVLVVVSILVIDQWSKWAVLTKMTQGESFPVIDRLFYITYVKNPGAAFGLLPYRTAFFISVTLIVILAILIYYRRLARDRVWLRLGLALQVGGALGNLVDRIRFGHVIDFFDFRIWPVFNVADICISIGVGILFLELFRSEQAGAQKDSSGGRKPIGD